MANFKLSVDDGCASDVRVAELSKKYGIETVFYWPVEWHSLAYDKGYEPLSLWNADKIAKDFEIGSHGLTHVYLTQVDRDTAIREISDSQWLLKRMFSQEIKKFCAPRGYMNDELTEIALTQYESVRLTKGDGLVHIHPNSGANGNMHWIDYAATIDVKEFWGHSHEFDRYNMWDDIEAYFKEHA